MLSVQDAAGEPDAGTSAASDATAEPALERVYERRDATGAPRPLAPSLATLSMLPRPQWQTLVHLDAIQARSRPQQPPKKPDAAPFFLPTVAGRRLSLEPDILLHPSSPRPGVAADDNIWRLWSPPRLWCASSM